MFEKILKIKKIINSIKSYLNFEGVKIIFYGLPIALLIRLIQKFFLVRIMFINSERIGEFLITPIIYLLHMHYL